MYACMDVCIHVSIFTYIQPSMYKAHGRGHTPKDTALDGTAPPVQVPEMDKHLLGIWCRGARRISIGS